MGKDYKHKEYPGLTKAESTRLTNLLEKTALHGTDLEELKGEIKQNLNWDAVAHVIIAFMSSIHAAESLMRRAKQEAKAEHAKALKRAGNALKVLGITLDQAKVPAELKRAYRARAKDLHPDLGGDTGMMAALNEAYTKLKKLAV